MTSRFISIAALGGLAALSLGQTPPRPEVTLKVGDPAPPLEATWLKGTPTTKFGDGKVHVVEFWATWCGPCRMNMPHLSKLAQKYRGEVSVTSVSIWEASHQKDKAMDYMGKVKSFVDNSHDMMDFAVGVDGKDEKIGNSWMRAAGQNGIPCTFVIDQEGKIAWIGVPFAGLDEIVPLVMARKFDAEAAAKVRTDYRARLAKHQEYQKASETAMKAGDYQKALEAAEGAIQTDPVFDDYVIPLKYQALDRLDRNRARAYAREIMKSHKNAPVLFINMWARNILSDNYQNPDYTIALELMQAGMRCVDFNEGFQADLLAQAYFKTGNFAKAVETQEKLLKAMDDPVREATSDVKSAAQKKLDTYKAQLNQNK